MAASTLRSAFIRRELWAGWGRSAHPGGLAALTGDYKSALQEVLQAAGRGLPEYRVVREHGPAHDRLFDVELRVSGDARRAGSRPEQEGSRAGSGSDRIEQVPKYEGRSHES